MDAHILSFVRLKNDQNCLRFANPAEAATNSANMARISTKLRQNAFRTICNFRFFDAKKIFLKIFSISESGFSQFSADFGGARLFLTSKSDSWRYFASDGQIFRSVGRLELILESGWSCLGLAAGSDPPAGERAGPSYARS